MSLDGPSQTRCHPLRLMTQSQFYSKHFKICYLIKNVKFQKFARESLQFNRKLTFYDRF